MTRPLVLVHGLWDTPRVFHRLIQRLDQNGASARCRRIGGITQVFDKAGLRRFATGKSRQHMDVAGIDGIGVIQRRVDAGTRFRFASDKRRQPVLASPNIATRRVQP